MLALNTEMPTPGPYTLRVRLAGLEPGDEVWSNGVRVRLRDPKGLENEAYDYIVRTGRARVFFTSVTELDPGAEGQLETVANLYADTPYADYATLAFGRIALGKEDREAARSYLMKVAGKPEFQRWRESASVLQEVGLKRQKD